jgi:hypothetical protein
MFTHSIQRTYNDGITNTGGVETVTADSTRNFDGTVPGSGTPDYEIDFPLTRANLKSVCISTDKALTIWINHSSEDVGEDIAVPAGQPVIWSLAANGLDSCPFVDDVTKLYVTVVGTAPAILKIRALSDQTPA